MSKTTVDTIIHSRWLLTFNPNDELCLEEHSLAIDQGQIKAIAPRAEIDSRFDSKQTHHLNDHHVLMPGFINNHTHAAMNLLRGIADDLALQPWLENHIWPREAKWLSEEFVADGTELAIAELIRSGTTCFNDMYFFPDVMAEVCQQAGIRACIGLTVMQFANNWAKDLQQYIDKGLTVYHAHKDKPLIQFSWAPHAIYSVPDETLQQLADINNDLGLTVSMHVHETAFEVEQSLQETGKRPLQRIDEAGLLNHRFNAVHLTQLNAQDITLLKQSGAHAVHCPQSNMKLASGYSPVDQMLKAGINVTIGTDGAASNNDLSMLDELRNAAMLAKLMGQDPRLLPAETVLSMATRNGAKALQWQKSIGQLTSGFSADCIAIDLNQLNTQPVYHPAAQIAYSAESSQVSDVWVAGKQLLANGELTTLDKEALLAKAKSWQQRLASA